VYIVDRRAVVDQATDTAEGLRAWVQSEPGVAEALALAGQPLPISTLRGQYVDNRAWLADPSGPAIVLGTVDMIGSRLLFSGYGVSRKMRPYHAGLLGADTLMVLDAAHRTPALERLLDQLATGRDANGRPLGPATAGVVPPLRFMSLSATGPRRHRWLACRADDGWRWPTPRPRSSTVNGERVSSTHQSDVSLNPADVR
jgi:CRISPR-associated endonuclease/helicase Cas3